MDLLSEAEAAQDSVAVLRLLSRHFIEQLANRAGLKSRAVGVQATTPRCCGMSGRASNSRGEPMLFDDILSGFGTGPVF
jgi:hypothetical protein